MELCVIGAKEINRLAYDWIRVNLYYGDYGANRIELCHLASQLCAVVIYEGAAVFKPVGVAVHPKIGRMFWVNDGVHQQQRWHARVQS